MAVPSSRSSRMRTSITSAASTSSTIDGATAPTRRCPRPAGLRLMREDFPAWLVEDFEYYDSPIPETVAVSGVPDRDFDPAGWTTPLTEATSFVDEGDVIDLGDRVVRRAPHTRATRPASICLLDDANGTIFSGRRDLRRCEARLGGSGGVRRFARAVARPGRSASFTAATDDRSMRSTFVRRRTRHWRRWARTAAIPASESSIRGQQTLRELACQDRHAAGRATSHPGGLSTHPRSSACAVGPERAPDDATPCIPLGPIGSCPVVRFARRSPTTSVPAKTPAPRRSPCGRWTIGRRGSRCVPRFRYRSSRAHAASPVGRVSGLGRPGDSADMLAAYGRATRSSFPIA